jgi:hypothetical protein
MARETTLSLRQRGRLDPVVGPDGADERQVGDTAELIAAGFHHEGAGGGDVAFGPMAEDPGHRLRGLGDLGFGVASRGARTEKPQAQRTAFAATVDAELGAGQVELDQDYVRALAGGPRLGTERLGADLGERVENGRGHLG